MNQYNPIPRHSPSTLLDVTVASKETLKGELYSLLKMPDFGGKEPLLFTLVNNLLEELEDDISFLIEFFYIDRHYRDTYYSFFSSKFKSIDRECIRVHIFNKMVNKDDVFNKAANLSENYLGFFIIRPLKLHMLGRSLISPKAYKNNKFVCCLMKERVSLFGKELVVYGFPQIAQDEETHTCAESTLWCLYEYYGSNYPQYRQLLPSQIIELLQSSAERQILPSKGLNKNELARCLNSNGFQSIVYPISSKFPGILFYNLLNIYIESGIPLLLILYGKMGGHAVLVVGHEEDDDIYYKQNENNPWAKYDDSYWADVSLMQKKLVFIDDNKPPYYISSLKSYINSEGKTALTYRDYDVNSFIVPLPAHMFLVAETVLDLLWLIFNNPYIGFEKRKEKKITRLLLTSSYSFKKFIFEHENKMDPDFKQVFLRLPLPKYIWLCEIYNKHEFVKDGYCTGLVIIDATSDGRSLSSVLFYMLDENKYFHNNFDWNEKPVKTTSFKMQTYRNNLKGEWSQWTTNLKPA